MKVFILELLGFPTTSNFKMTNLTMKDSSTHLQYHKSVMQPAEIKAFKIQFKIHIYIILSNNSTAYINKNTSTTFESKHLQTL